MGIFQQFPYSNFHEMNLDGILKMVKENEDKIDDFILDISDQIDDSVDEWIRNHPEYVTTVQDHTIKSIKFYSESVPFYNVLDYGVTPNGTDNYEQIHDLFVNYVYNTGGIVYFPAGRYITSDTLFIPENTMIIGDGADTEIFFDEQNTTYGVGLSNAGSNITIKNIKVTQRTTGILHTGSQPGCIGFSNNDRSMGTSELHTTTFIRAAAYNLKAEDIYTDDSIYLLQCENTTDSSITNVIYKNIYAPESCVSVMASSAGIYNVTIDNIQCDAFRITWNDNLTGGIYRNVIANNIKCHTPIFNARHIEDHIIINNLVQTTDARQNALLTSQYSGVVDGNFIFNDCIFNMLDSENSGLFLYGGIRTWLRCTFNTNGKAFSRNMGLSDTTNYEIMNDCIINCGSGTETLILGYGARNTYNGLIKNLLWGDMHRIVPINKFGTVTGVSSSVPNCVKVENDLMILQLYVQCADSENILTLNTTAKALLNALTSNLIPVVLFNSSTPNAHINSFAIFDSVTGILKTIEPAYSGANAANYNRAKCSAPIMVTAQPNPQQIYNLFN